MQRFIGGVELKKRLFLLALLLAAALAGPARVHAQEAGGKTYIVRYVQDTCDAQDQGAEAQSSRPSFGAVDRSMLRILQKEGAIAWYEEDITVYLPDAAGLGDPATSADAESFSGSAKELSIKASDASPATDEGESPYWQLRMIGAQETDETAGTGIRVAVIDSGAAAHPALARCMQTGWNYVDGTSATPDANGHGTAVCGLIAGLAADGAMGPAPGASLIPLKCFEGTTTKVSLICEAICDAADVYDCDIINLSVGVQQSSSSLNALKEAAAYAASKGVLIVAACGNGGTQALYYPAACEEAIGVASVDETGLVYKSSNHNESVFIAAPGVEVVSAKRTGGTDAFTGTSFSTPLVTGAIAALMAEESALDMNAVRALLASRAEDRGKEGLDEYYGHGILQLAPCLEILSAKGKALLLPPVPGESALLALNRTDSPLACSLVTSSFCEGGRFLGLSAASLEIPAKSSLPAELPEGNWRAFLCDEHFAPLAPALSGN